jgi:hypothetical protein
MAEKTLKSLTTVLFRRRAGITNKRGRLSYDPFFADPETVEDDYRRLKTSHG